VRRRCVRPVAIGVTKLETVKIGSQIITSKQAVARFIEKTNDNRP
jgi:hypothetical protein